jgi:hypothetical protein
MTPRQLLRFRVCAEIIIAAVIGFFITVKSSWWDPDQVIAFCWWPVLLAFGLLFGLFGRCPVLAIGPVTAWSGILVEILDVFHYGFSVDVLILYATLFATMATAVIVGAAIGRGAKRSWIKRELTHVA